MNSFIATAGILVQQQYMRITVETDKKRQRVSRAKSLPIAQVSGDGDIER